MTILAIPRGEVVRIRNARLGARLCDVTLSGDRITEIRNASGSVEPGPDFDGRGGALLPGLHDHHLHLLAWAARLDSVDCGPPEVEGRDALAGALSGAAPDGNGWIRGTNYHESVAGELDRDRVDSWRSDVPVRIQHRSGAAWFLNSKAVAVLGLDAGMDPPGVARDARGRATGQLRRLDMWLRERLPASSPDLAPIGLALSQWGVTGVTDATASNGPEELALIDAARSSGALPQHVHWMGGASLPAASTGSPVRPLKLVLDDWDLPHPDALADRISGSHRASRPVAIHCVTRAEGVAACAALEQAGVLSGDRIEHAFVAPPDLVEWLAGLGVSVVVQPGFLHDRGDAYLRDVEPRDRPWLLRVGAIVDADIPVGAGSDAPFGPADPWLAMRTAVDRRTRANRALGSAEAVSPERALALYTTAPGAPGGAARRIEVGASADLCLLDRPWEQARQNLDASAVRATWCDGGLVWDRETPPRPRQG